jgi:excisionase family DNA binding protein
LLTTREAAAISRVTEVTVARWVKPGRLRAYRVGPWAVRVRRSDAERLMEPLSSQALTDVPARGGQGSANSAAAMVTDADLERGWQALRELVVLGGRIAAWRGGIPLSESAELIRNEREERSHQRFEVTDAIYQPIRRKELASIEIDLAARQFPRLPI